MTNLHALVGLIGLIALCGVVYGPWQSACTDYFRQPLFEARDALFNLAACDQIGFSHPAYMIMRDRINHMIRFAESLTFWRILFHVQFSPGLPPDRAISRNFIYDITNIETRNALQAIERKCSHAMVGMMFAKSPILWLVIVAALPLAGLFAFTMDIKRVLSPLFFGLAEKIQAEAYLAE